MNENKLKIDFSNKQEMITKLDTYKYTPDDDTILIKERIGKNLLDSFEILYLLNSDKFENELFDDDGNIIEDGERSLYFGEYIKPYIAFPATQVQAQNYICYTVNFNSIPRYNDYEKYCDVSFTIYCDIKTIMVDEVGVPRHDLIASVIRERFNWSNIFGNKVKLSVSKEAITDTDYVTRTLVFESVRINSITKTTNGVTSITNNRIKRS